jgi:hypothetical protein
MVKLLLLALLATPAVAAPLVQPQDLNNVAITTWTMGTAVSSSNFSGGNGRVSQTFAIANSSPTVALTLYGVASSSTTSPTVTCGAGTPVMTPGSSTQAGSYAAGALATGCTVTFTQTFNKAPFCLCQATASLVVWASATTPASVTCTSATAMTGDTINYFCWGQP